MNLYLLTQNENNGYDTYDSMVVSAENEEDAKYLSLVRSYDISDTPPQTWGYSPEPVWRDYYKNDSCGHTWSWNPTIELIGTSIIGEGLVCESFNAR